MLKGVSPLVQPCGAWELSLLGLAADAFPSYAIPPAVQVGGVVFHCVLLVFMYMGDLPFLHLRRPEEALDPLELES